MEELIDIIFSNSFIYISLILTFLFYANLLKKLILSKTLINLFIL